ncbi:MAG TPA: BMP family ABC transporter substrate-binding protein [Candidatus Scybalosoma faecavium]|nr:BMP family ABC transporter substrate-binding protein [Candidatus Scybalosoma faecavium]
MKLKKILAAGMAAVMCLGMAACSGGSESSAPASEAPASAADTAAASSEASSESSALTPVAKEDLNIGFVHISDPSDKGYTYNHDLGTQKMVKDLGLNEDQIINKYYTAEGDATTTALQELVDQGCQIIFATSFGFEPYVVEMAKAHPEIQFCHATGEQAAEVNLPNYHNYFTGIHEVRYLTGIAAGMKLNELGETKLGYVAAFPYAECISAYSAFYLGAKSVCPEATMDVIYTQQWNDPTTEAQVAQKLIDSGCVVLGQDADSTATATTAENNGVFQVGYNSDMIEAAPKASLISARSDWSIYLDYAVQCVIDGKAIDTDWCQGLADGAVYLSPLNTDIAAEGTQEALDEATEKIKSGELEVFAGPLKGTNTVEGGEDLDIAEGEAFHESVDRSAPYFTYILEGVNVISGES